MGLLVLTHLSSRFAPRDLRAEAESVFARVLVPRDFDQVEIPFPERGCADRAPGQRRRRPASGGPDGMSDAPATLPVVDL